MGGLSPDQQARAVYLMLLVAAIGVYVIAQYRGRLSEGLQHAAIWVLIFLGAIVAYGFKDEIQRQLDPRAAQISEAGAIEVPRAGDGHFHLRLEIDGVPVEFLVDTGATEMVLSLRDAGRIGLAREDLAFTRAAQTANGVVMGAPVLLDRVELAGRVERDVPAVVNGGALGTSLLGMRYLDRFARVEIEGDRLRLWR